MPSGKAQAAACGRKTEVGYLGRRLVGWFWGGWVCRRALAGWGFLRFQGLGGGAGGAGVLFGGGGWWGGFGVGGGWLVDGLAGDAASWGGAGWWMGW